MEYLITIKEGLPILFVVILFVVGFVFFANKLFTGKALNNGYVAMGYVLFMIIYLYILIAIGITYLKS